MKPVYGKPSQVLVDVSLDDASRFASFRNPRLVVLDVQRIVPREMIVLDDGLVELMKESPGSISPIVVAPWGDVHVVVDGHHRLAASFESGLKAIWVVEVELLRLKHLVWPEWY